MAPSQNQLKALKFYLMSLVFYSSLQVTHSRLHNLSAPR